jgi:hypothetical protein
MQGCRRRCRRSGHLPPWGFCLPPPLISFAFLLSLALLQWVCVRVGCTGVLQERAATMKAGATGRSTERCVCGVLTNGAA